MQLRKNPKLSIIILNYNSIDYTLNCLRSLKSLYNPNLEIIVVDNASEEINTQEKLSEISGIQFIQNKKNTGFTGGNNFGAKHATGDFLLFLNNDTIVKDDFIKNLMEVCNNSDNLSLITGYIEGPSGKPQYSGGLEPTLLTEFLRYTLFQLYYIPFHCIQKRRLKTWESDLKQELQWATGCLLAIPRQLFEEINGFDENIFMYKEDVDLCQRARKCGAKIYYYPHIRIQHFGGRSLPDDRLDAFVHEYQSTIYYLKKYNFPAVVMIWQLAVKIFMVLDIALLMVPALITRNRKILKRYNRLKKLVLT